MTVSSHDELTEALGRARSGSSKRVKELLQSSPRRAHVLLRAGIRRRLLTGRDAFAEQNLVMSMMMTRNSIRSALQMLGSEGLIERRQKIGTKVVAGISELPLLEMLPVGSWRSAAGDIEHPALGVELEHVERTTVLADQYIRTRLQLDDSRVILQEDLVHRGGEVIGIIVGYHRPESPDPRDDLETQISELRAMSESHIEATVEAVNCDERTAKALGIEPGSALLVRETLVRDPSGKPRMLAYGHYRGDRVALWARDDSVRGMRRVGAESP
ncbi:UTRA domain-containing protein [Nocardia sp. NPDC051750]|uniref:UTRA domain-containing protein n=1 Tax=Nocardia sp. NPDC051750 TaxID=3364325 RepID=UPI0037A9C46F